MWCIEVDYPPCRYIAHSVIMREVLDVWALLVSCFCAPLVVSIISVTRIE